MGGLLTNSGMVINMARARRAKPRPSRALIGLLVVALLAGGVVAALRFWPGSLTAIGSTLTPAAVSTPSATGSSPATNAEPTASPTASTSTGSTPTARPASSETVRALEACQQRVRAADQVLEQARTGVEHWASHVRAERDAQRGDISVDERQAIFKATRSKGPEDQKRFADAQRAYDKVRDASCDEAEGADAKVTATLAGCQDRAAAQQPVMKAAAAAMGDWKSHLADMQRSREVHVDNAQEIWLAAYRAAPENLDAYDRALRDFDPPRC